MSGPVGQRSVPTPRRSRFTIWLLGAALAAASAASCTRPIRFDDPPADGGTTPDDMESLDSPAAEDVSPRDLPPGEDLATGQDLATSPDACPADSACGWFTEACDSAPCPIECTEGKRCGGSCGDACVSTCEDDSSCSLMTGVNSRATCHESATCSLVLGGGGVVNCLGGSNCQTECLGPCLIICASSATCKLRCSSESAPRSVAAGTSVTCS